MRHVGVDLHLLLRRCTRPRLVLLHKLPSCSNTRRPPTRTCTIRHWALQPLQLCLLVRPHIGCQLPDRHGTNDDSATPETNDTNDALNKFYISLLSCTEVLRETSHQRDNFPLPILKIPRRLETRLETPRLYRPTIYFFFRSRVCGSGAVKIWSKRNDPKRRKSSAVLVKG